MMRMPSTKTVLFASLVAVAAASSGGPAAASGDSSTLTGRAVHKYAQAGPRNQPRRTPKSKR